MNKRLSFQLYPFIHVFHNISKSFLMETVENKCYLSTIYSRYPHKCGFNIALLKQQGGKKALPFIFGCSKQLVFLGSELCLEDHSTFKFESCIKARLKNGSAMHVRNNHLNYTSICEFRQVFLISERINA